MRELERRIQEKRSIEATKKKLMGFNGKLGCIVRNLGQPLITHSQGGGLHDVGPTFGYEEAYENDTPLEHLRTTHELKRRLPTMEVLDELGNPIPDVEGKEWDDPNDRTYFGTDHIGWHFDGLSRGMHLEIKFEDLNKLLTVTFKGHEVYREEAGELYAYAPSPMWEDLIDRLYKIAQPMEMDKKMESRKEDIAEAKKMKEGWWEETRKKWGL